MGNERSGSRNRRQNVMGLWRLALAIIGVIAIVQELRKAPEERAWHGKVGGVVPYDFRRPTVHRLRDTYWNPEGPIISSRAWGVGWAPNLGAIKNMLGPRST